VNKVELNNFGKLSGINIFPNPTNGLVKISNTSMIQSIKVIDATGRVIIEKEPEAEEVSVDLSKYSNGTYTMEVTLTEGVIRRKVIKQ
jgi:hypothetical protein